MASLWKLWLVHNAEGALSHVNHAWSLSLLFDEKMTALKLATIESSVSSKPFLSLNAAATQSQGLEIAKSPLVDSKQSVSCFSCKSLRLFGINPGLALLKRNMRLV